MNYSHITTLIQADLASVINSLTENSVEVRAEIQIPTDRTKADLVSNVAFQLSKILKLSPIDSAKLIVDKLSENDTQKSYTVEAVMPGFINFRLESRVLSRVLDEVTSKGSDYGRNKSLEGQTWLIEHTSPNPNKAMHVGHLRNNLTGMAVANIAEFSGAKVFRDCIDNDRGIAIARAMYGYLAFKRRDLNSQASVEYWVTHQDEWLKPDELGVKPDHFVGDCYALGADAAKSDPEADAQIRDMVVKWENHDEATWKLWAVVLEFAHTGINQTLDRIGNKWDYVWHEHEHYAKGRDMINAGLAKGTFKQLSDGAVLTNLESYNIPDTIVLKSDGTSLYITQDLELTRLKKEKFQADKMFWVIGPEQSVAMKQVFAICDQLGIGSYDSFVHLPYGLVNVADADGNRKKMSSRDGNVLLIDDFIDQVKVAVLASDRGYDDQSAEDIAISAVKYALLKPSRTTDTIVDIVQATSLDGDSGLYLLYTLARIKTLLAKSDIDLAQPRGLAEMNETEREVALSVMYFPHKVLDAIETMTPNTILDYLVDLAHGFNSLYAKEKFITDDDKATAAKLKLASATAQVFKNSLNLLGIKIVEKI